MYDRNFGARAGFNAGRLGGARVAAPVMAAPAPALAQGPSFIEVTVIDARTERPIPGATITVRHGGRERSWTADVAGSISDDLAVNAGEPVEVTVSAPGYRTKVNPTVFTWPQRGMSRAIFALTPVAAVDGLVGAGGLALLLGAVFFA